MSYGFQDFDMKDEIVKYIVDHCLLTAPSGEYFFGKLPGARYDSQYYLSHLLYDQQMMSMIAFQFASIVEREIGHWDFQICGREWSSLPLLMSLPIYMNIRDSIKLNSFMIKRDRKTYGIHNYIEGTPNEQPVLIVDDILNSTDSFRHCRQVVTSKEVGLQTIPFVFAVVNKYRYKHYGEAEPVYYDRYLGRNHRALSIVTGDDIHAARRR